MPIVVRVRSGRDLAVTPSNNPEQYFVVCELGADKFKSPEITTLGDPIFNTIFQFPDRDTLGVLKITVMGANNDFMGFASLNPADKADGEEHELWVPISNPKKASPGTLLISILCGVRSEDIRNNGYKPAVPLSETTVNEENAPQGKEEDPEDDAPREDNKMYVEVVECRNLTEEMDTFCSLKVGSVKKKTKLRVGTKAPKYGDAFVFTDATEDDVLVVGVWRVMLVDNVIKDLYMGSIRVSLSNIWEEGTNTTLWYDLADRPREETVGINTNTTKPQVRVRLYKAPTPSDEDDEDEEAGEETETAAPEESKPTSPAEDEATAAEMIAADSGEQEGEENSEEKKEEENTSEAAAEDAAEPMKEDPPNPFHSRLDVGVIRGRDFKKKMDIYFKIRLGGENSTCQTHTCKKTMEPKYTGQTFCFLRPSLNGFVEIQAWEKDSFSKDTFWGSTFISVDTLNNEVVNAWFDLEPKRREGAPTFTSSGKPQVFLHLACQNAIDEITERELASDKCLWITPLEATNMPEEVAIKCVYSVAHQEIEGEMSEMSLTPTWEEEGTVSLEHVLPYDVVKVTVLDQTNEKLGIIHLGMNPLVGGEDHTLWFDIISHVKGLSQSYKEPTEEGPYPQIRLRLAYRATKFKAEYMEEGKLKAVSSLLGGPDLASLPRAAVDANDALLNDAELLSKIEESSKPAKSQVGSKYSSFGPEDEVPGESPRKRALRKKNQIKRTYNNVPKHLIPGITDRAKYYMQAKDTPGPGQYDDPRQNFGNAYTPGGNILFQGAKPIIHHSNYRVTRTQPSTLHSSVAMSFGREQLGGAPKQYISKHHNATMVRYDGPGPGGYSPGAKLLPRNLKNPPAYSMSGEALGGY